MSTILTFETLVGDRVRDSGAKITTAQLDRAIVEAVKRHNRLRPIEAIQDYAGDGTTFDFSVPTGWVDSFSLVRAIEYPAGRRPPVLLEAEDWQLYRSATTTVKIRLTSSTPAVGETVRVSWTKPHTVDQSQSTIPAQDEEAVANLAAAVALRQLAAYYANTVDATIQADSVNYRSKSSEYSKLAAELEQRYRDHLGIREGASELVAGGAFVDQDQQTTHGLDKLTHPNRRR